MLVLVCKDSLRTYFMSWSLGSGLCSCGLSPCPGPCGLVLVFSPCKDLFPLFRFIRIIHCSIQCSEWKISRNGTLYSPILEHSEAIETLELKHLANYD